VNGRLLFLFLSPCLLLSALCGCAVIEVSGEAVGVLGKAAWAGTKAVGGMVSTGASMAGQTAQQTNETMTRPSQSVSKQARGTLASGQTRVPLIREGKSYFVRVKLNDKVWGRFLLDTGASAMQISGAMARKLKVKPERGKVIPVTLAGGAMVAGRPVVLKKVQVGEAAVENVVAIVLEGDQQGLRDGLLGMSFLENFVFQMDTVRSELILERR
jgi:Predicted aspartyl protease